MKAVPGLNVRDIPAVILGEANNHTLGFVRSLGGRGIPTLAMSTKPAPRIWSRYCVACYGVDNETALLELLGKVAARKPRIGVLIPTGDREMLFLSRNREELEKHYRFALPSADTVERLANKRSQYQYAQSIGIEIPQTYYPETLEDVKKIATSIPFPCVIKPAYSHIWRDRTGRGTERFKAKEIATPEQLCSTYEKMSESLVEIVVQERIEGPDSQLHSLYVYLNRHSEPLAFCVLQKIRQWPANYGSGSYSVTCRRDELVVLGLQLLKTIRYVGLANLEFKHDLKDGTFKLIEANVRSGERIALAIAAGVDLPYIAYRDIIGERIDPIENYTIGLKWVNLITDTAAFFYYYRKQISWWRWVLSLSQARCHAYFSWKDPFPFLRHAFQALRQALAVFFKNREL